MDTTQLQKKDKSDELNIQRFIQAYLKTGNATEAYLSIKPNVTRESARELGHRMLSKVDFSQLMEDEGLTDKILINMLALGLTRPVRKILKRTKTYYKESDTDEVKYTKDKNGRVVALNSQQITEMEYGDEIDYRTRREYLETALKLKKRLGLPAGNNIEIGELIFQWGDTPPAQPQQQIIEGQTLDNTSD